MPLITAARLARLLNTELSYEVENKNAFHAEGKKVLHELAHRLGLPKGSYEVRSNKGGIAVSGEVTLHGKHIYVQISQFSCGRHMDVLYRRCNGREDYTGEENHFCSAADIFSDKVILSMRNLNERA